MYRQQLTRSPILAYLVLALLSILLGWHFAFPSVHVGEAAAPSVASEASQIQCPDGVVVTRLCPPGILPVQDLVQVENSRHGGALETLSRIDVESQPWYMDITDVIHTDSQGAMGLEWWDTSTLGQIHANTVARIEDDGLTLRVGLVLLRMTSGGCTRVLPKVQTPPAYVDACGTYFAVQVFSDGTTVAANISDGTASTVWVTSKNPQRRVPLGPDTETTVRPGQVPDQPRQRRGPPWAAPPAPGGVAVGITSAPSVPPIDSRGTGGGLLAPRPR